jgi:hypothetical protein
MHAAAVRPVTGPASTDTLAASGGLDVPGGEVRTHLPPAPDAAADAMIPGERDATTMIPREPGAIGGQFAGADIPSTPPEGVMDERTALERAKEGGGDAAYRLHPANRREQR